VPTLRALGEFLARADCIDSLEPVAALMGCAGAAPLDVDTLTALGIRDLVVAARVATGPGAIRALLIQPATNDLKPGITRLANRLATRAPHVLWIVLATHPSGHLAIAAWPANERRVRISALVVNRKDLVDSDAETLRAMCAAGDGGDLLVHARWVEVLGREALSARFYRGLERSVSMIADSSRAGSEPNRRELALLNSSRLLFLCFLEAKGWLDSDSSFLAHSFERCAASGGRFHERVLRPLFFGTLNTPPKRRAAAARKLGNIPFLNGGLFALTPLEHRARNVRFSDDAFGALIYDLFSQYRFTAAEESSAWREAAVDPEMLGRSFESLMHLSERRDTGAFYTPFSLVERVASSALQEAGLRDRPSIEALTILDPACGSGAFLVHALERVAASLAELGDHRETGRIRRDVLTRSIFGVDINPTAVWLCQLRLWLSVVIETETRDPSAVVPLPNLDRNIRVGDALSGAAFDGARAIGGAHVRRLRERYARATGTRKQSLARELDRADRKRALAVLDAELLGVAELRRDLISARRGRDLFGDRYRPSRDEKSAAEQWKARASELRGLRRRLINGAALPFSFPVYFADVAARGGFMVIVGNPPWVRLHRIPREQRTLFRREFEVARAAAWNAGTGLSGAGSGFAAQVDVASLFIERSVRLAAPGGSIALLVPSKLWQSLAGGGVRRLLEAETVVCRLEDHSNAPALFDAAVYPSLVLARRTPTEALPRDRVNVAVTHRGHDLVAWTTSRKALPFDDTPGAPWILLPPEARRVFDLLRSSGQTLAESAIGRPYLGVKCGYNDAFIVELLEADGELAHVLTSDGKPLTLERSMVRPLLRGERLRRWRASAGRDAIIWTHDANGALARLPPLASKWFARWKRELSARSDARHRERWWSLFRTESARCDRPRVVWADVGKEPRASVLGAGDPRVPLNTCYVVRCRDEIDAHAFAALLNSPLARAWLDTVAGIGTSTVVASADPSPPPLR
jgi:methylase of polypeptide subunit release factors